MFTLTFRQLDLPFFVEIVKNLFKILRTSSPPCGPIWPSLSPTSAVSICRVCSGHLHTWKDPFRRCWSQFYVLWREQCSMTLQNPDAVVVGMINMIVAIATNMFDVIKHIWFIWDTSWSMRGHHSVDYSRCTRSIRELPHRLIKKKVNSLWGNAARKGTLGEVSKEKDECGKSPEENLSDNSRFYRPRGEGGKIERYMHII